MKKKVRFLVEITVTANRRNMRWVKNELKREVKDHTYRIMHDLMCRKYYWESVSNFKIKDFDRVVNGAKRQYRSET